MGGGQPGGGGSETEAAMAATASAAAAAAEVFGKTVGSAASPWPPQRPEQPARALFPSDFDDNNGRPAAEPPAVLRPKSWPAARAPLRPHRAHADGPGLFRVRPRRPRTSLRRRLALLPSNRTSPTAAFSGATAIQMLSAICQQQWRWDLRDVLAAGDLPALQWLPGELVDAAAAPTPPAAAAAAGRRTAAMAAEAVKQRQSKLLPFQRRFAQLQAFLAAADAAAASDELVEELQALSDADRMEHRRNLERRALWLSAIEGMEMELVQRAGVLASRLPSRRCAGIDDAQQSLPPVLANRNSTSGPQPLWLSASKALTTSVGASPSLLGSCSSFSPAVIEAVAFDTQMLANFFLVSFVPFLNSSVASGAPALAAPVVANAEPLPVASAAAAAAAARNTTRRLVWASSWAAHLTGPACAQQHPWFSVRYTSR
eukprot:SM000208S06306  [mRNA]  locus=s208:24014:26165:+ [translate_table: standard]